MIFPCPKPRPQPKKVRKPLGQRASYITDTPAWRVLGHPHRFELSWQARA